MRLLPCLLVGAKRVRPLPCLLVGSTISLKLGPHTPLARLGAPFAMFVGGGQEGAPFAMFVGGKYNFPKVRPTHTFECLLVGSTCSLKFASRQGPGGTAAEAPHAAAGVSAHHALAGAKARGNLLIGDGWSGRFKTQLRDMYPHWFKTQLRDMYPHFGVDTFGCLQRDTPPARFPLVLDVGQDVGGCLPQTKRLTRVTFFRR